MGQHRHHQRNAQPIDEHRPCQTPRAGARCLQYGQLGFAGHAVDHINRPRKGRDWQHCGDQLGQSQHSEFQKHQRGLAVADQSVKQHHSTVDPKNRDQNQRKKAKQDQELGQHIAVELGQSASLRYQRGLTFAQR